MSEKWTKEQIQEEYNKLVAEFGQIVYRSIAPLFEIAVIGKHLLSLNKQMHKILSEEAEAKKF